MRDGDKTREQLIDELATLRRRSVVLEAADTQRKRVEGALRTSHEELERRVEERTAALRGSQRSASTGG